ncbi:MAG: hypothetical protein M3P04_01560, partial [Actinomycetota bacterium]|nr:hypothetical protein [Actinomycetota bacterium]
AAAAATEPERTAFDQEQPAAEADNGLVGRVAADRLERVRAAMAPSGTESPSASAPRTDALPDRPVDRGNRRGGSARRNGRATRAGAGPAEPEATPRLVSNGQAGTSSAVTPVQLSFGQSDSVPVATPARSEG